MVEDFEALADSIGTGLRRKGMAVYVALDGTDALADLAITLNDVVILERELPGWTATTSPGDRRRPPRHEGADADRRRYGQGPR